jgi:hypothetical protein
MTIRWEGIPKFTAAVDGLVIRVERGAQTGTREGAEIVKRHIQSHMHGRPGPNYITGNLHDSIKIKATLGGIGRGRWAYAVYADMIQAPYARRIEKGFRGSDSIGRNYNQPPYPYFGPGVRDAVISHEVREVFATAIGGAIKL